MAMNGEIELLRTARRETERALALIDKSLHALEHDGAQRGGPADSAQSDIAEFMRSHTVAAPQGETLRAEGLYDLYVALCRKAGRAACSNTLFGRRLTVLGYRKYRNGRVLYLGLKLSDLGRALAAEAHISVEWAAITTDYS